MSRKAQEIKENIEIARSLARHHEMWMDKAFVDRRVEEQREIIRLAEEAIAKFTKMHEESAAKVQYYKTREQELLADLHRETVQPEIDKLAKYAKQIEELTAKLGAEAVEEILKGLKGQ